MVFNYSKPLFLHLNMLGGYEESTVACAVVNT